MKIALGASKSNVLRMDWKLMSKKLESISSQLMKGNAHLSSKVHRAVFSTTFGTQATNSGSRLHSNILLKTSLCASSAATQKAGSNFDHLI